MHSYKDYIKFTPDAFKPVLIDSSDRTRVISVCLEEGQFIPIHTPDCDLVFILMEGEALVKSGSIEEKLGPGELIIVPAGHSRGVKAIKRMVALHIVTPHPSSADHQEVLDKLSKGSFE
jgi:quercetin dioxygenase-like cupin family protein